MSEIGNNSEQFINTSLAEATEQTNTEKPVVMQPEMDQDKTLENQKSTDVLVTNKTHENVLETTENINSGTNDVPVVEMAEENMDTSENVEDLELELINPVIIPQITAVEHIDVLESNERDNLTEAFEKIENLTPKELPKDISEDTLGTTLNNPNNEFELSASGSKVAEMSFAKNFTETMRNEETSIESAQVASEKSLEICSVETENSNKCYKNEITLPIAVNVVPEGVLSEVALETATDKLINESKTSYESAEIIHTESIKDLNNEPAITPMTSTESNEETPTLINEPDNKDDVPNKEPDMSLIESRYSNKETEIIDTPEIEAETKIEDILVIEDQIDLTEPLEPMDTCDSQESINLVIDETLNTTDNKEDAVDATKINNDSIMEVDHEQVLGTISQNLASADKLQEEISKETTEEIEQEEKKVTNQNKDLNVDTDKEQNIPTSENPEDRIVTETSIDLTAEISSLNVSENDINENLQTSANVTNEVLQTAEISSLNVLKNDKNENLQTSANITNEVLQTAEISSLNVFKNDKNENLQTSANVTNEVLQTAEISSLNVLKNDKNENLQTSANVTNEVLQTAEISSLNVFKNDKNENLPTSANVTNEVLQTAEISSLNVSKNDKNENLPTSANVTNEVLQTAEISSLNVFKNDKNENLPTSANVTNEVLQTAEISSFNVSKNDKNENLPTSANVTNEVLQTAEISSLNVFKNDKNENLPTSANVTNEVLQTAEISSLNVSKNDKNENLPTSANVTNEVLQTAEISSLNVFKNDKNENLQTAATVTNEVLQTAEVGSFNVSKNDKNENLQTAATVTNEVLQTAEIGSFNVSKNDKNENLQTAAYVTKEVLQTPENSIVIEIADTTEKSSTMETNLLNKSKDDDVIPIEQPPVPIIEIFDEDDIEDITPITSNIAIKGTESAMQTEENIRKTVEIKESLVSIDVEMVDIAKTQVSSEVNKDSLLTTAYEKTLEDSLKPDETKKSSEDIEDTTDEVFYSKECINYECQHKHKQFFKVPQFAFSYFKVAKKKFKTQYVCSDCYDKALEMYEEFCGLINAKQPLLLENIPTCRQEFVEIIDSSDDEDIINKIKPTESAKSAFSKNDLNLIERELHNTIKTVLERVEIQNQLTWSKTILAERLKRLEVETEYVDGELKSLQKKADKMHEGLYTCPKIKIRQLQPLDLNSGKVMAFDTNAQNEVQPIPPFGEIERPGIKLNSMYYAVKNNAIASWVPCKVIEQVEGGLTAQKNVKHYKIKFIKNQVQMPKTVPAKYLAYYDPPSVRLPIGTRVIAYFDATSLARGREKINVQSAFYPGIIAEPLKPNNKFRYLIFYDDGYTQYVYHKDVRLVCHVSESVWEDVHPASRDFIQKYLTQYSINRPMVQTQKGQSMNTESNGYWLHARVVDIDCSLVLMQFEGSKSHTEWIYRGSLRLGPVFKEYQKTLQKSSPMPISRLPRRTEPFIRYTEDEESSSQQQTEKTNESTRAVARKTFGRPDSMINSAQPNQQQAQNYLPIVKHLNNSTIYVEDENKPKGKVVYYTAKRNLPPRKYKQHKCSPSCLFEITHNLSAYSPLSKPLLSGWERFIIRQKIKKVVTYRAPCGKIMRHMRELHHYLRVTQNVLNVDNFDFSHETNCLAEYVIESAIVQKRDISNGQEKMAIPLVNYYDNTLPPECKYSAKVIPTEGVHINTDPEFCVGCDCDNDCADKTKCACWQLTLTGAKYGNPNAAPEEVGYQYRRLLDHVPTGIYECNSNCKCKSSCLNRVVQNSLTMKLQVFKTSNRGWGLRCINDIPRGSFVCVYAGHLLTEAKANEGGQDAGDEYFAELDYIEVAEQIKEGYESEVDLPEPEDEEPYNPEGEDDEFTPSRSFLTRSKQKLNAAKSTRNAEEDSQERQVINFNPNADMNEDSVRENSIRKLYGNDEACYVMDAKISGNLGRYFNHSCAPNMFVQNVFVDTHDLRFPHVAFFSSCNIRAGTELTWNYNYEVGVVPGKVLYCQCGASNCRLRLL